MRGPILVNDIRGEAMKERLAGLQCRQRRTERRRQVLIRTAVTAAVAGGVGYVTTTVLAERARSTPPSRHGGSQSMEHSGATAG